MEEWLRRRNEYIDETWEEEEERGAQTAL